MAMAAVVFAVLFFTPAFAAQQSTGGSSAPPIVELLEKAKSAEQEKNIPKAMEAYKAVIDAYPNDERSAPAYFRLAQHHLESKDYGYSYTYFSAVVDGFPASPHRKESLIGLGVSLSAMRKYSEADSAFEAALQNPASEEQRAAILFNMGKSNYAAGKTLKAVSSLVECWNIPGELRPKAEKDIKEIIHVISSESELLSIAERYDRVFPAQYALLELMRIYQKKSDTLNLERTRERLEGNFPKMETPKEAAVSPSAPPPPPPSPQEYLTIGCILPLSGDQPERGAQALKGIQLAFSAKSAFVEKRHIKLTLKDSGDNPESSAVSLKELAADKSVAGVVGMFSGDTLAAALKQSPNSGLPIITPSQNARKELPPEGMRLLYETAVTNEEQIRLIADLATKKLGITTFAVLYPNDPYGIELSKLFIDRVGKNGGTIVVSEKFEPSQTDFREQMTALGGMDDQHLRAAIYSYAQEHSGKTVEDLNASLRAMYGGSPSIPKITKVKSMPLTKNNFAAAIDVKYQAVFLPATHQEAGLILPTLAFYNIANVQVLGADKFLSPDLMAIGGKYADDVFFTGEFHPAANRPDVKQFVESFQNTLGETPDMIAARYYDAVMMLLTLIEGGAGDRLKLYAALDGLKYYGGISGGVYRRTDGSMVKMPSIFTVTNGKIVEYQPPAPPEIQ